MAFTGRAWILPDRSPRHQEMVDRGLVALPLPDGGGQLYVRPADMDAHLGSKVDIVFDMNDRVEAARAQIGRVKWLEEYYFGELSPNMGVRIRTMNGPDEVRDFVGFLEEIENGR